MKTIFAFMSITFVAVLALIMGSRLPIDAITVLVGVGCGVLASIPTSVLILALVTRVDRQDSRGESYLAPRQRPAKLYFSEPAVIIYEPDRANKLPVIVESDERSYRHWD